MTSIHLPEDIGDLPFKLGAKTQSESYSTVIASNSAMNSYKIEPLQSDTDEIIPLATSEINRDLLGLGRRIKTTVLFRSTSRYDLEESQWSFATADSSTGDINTQSVIWTGRINVRATYPGTTVSVNFDAGQSAARIQCLPFSLVSGFQQGLLYSKRVFAPSMGAPIFLTFAVKMTTSLNINGKKQWGWFNGIAGYFFQIKSDGQGNNFSIVRRYNFESGITEEEITRSNFNGDKLDGTGNSRYSHAFSNIAMFGIEIGSGCGFHAKFWIYILGKWVLIHSIANISGGSQNPAINEVALPIAFAITNTSATGTTEFLFRYGTSVASLGEPVDDSIPSEVSTNKQLSAIPGKSYVLLGIRLKQDIKYLQNCNTLLPSFVTAYTKSLVTLSLIKNPADDSVLWTRIAFSGVEINTSRVDAFTGGKLIASIAIPANTGASISLKNLFSLQRDFGAAQYSNDPQLLTDTGYQGITGQDTYWLCITYIGFKSVLMENDLAWDITNSINTIITSNGSINPYITYVNNLVFDTTTSLSFLEV